MATEPEGTAQPVVTGEDGPVPGQPDRATVVAEIEAMIAKGELADPAKAGEDDPTVPDGKKPDEPSAIPDPKVDDKPAEEPKADEPTISAARKILAAADRKERAALAREASAKALEDKARLADTMVSALLADPEAFLAKYGSGKTFEDLLEAHLSAGPKAKPTETDEVKELRRRLDEREAREAAQAVQAEVAEQVKTIHSMVRDAKDGDAAKFPRLVKADTVGPFRGKAYDLVTDLIVETAREGKTLTPFQAAQEIETFLAELASGESTPKPSTAPAATKPTPRTVTAPPTRVGTQTLLNDETRDTPPATKELPMDLDERREAVRAQLRAEGLISD